MSRIAIHTLGTRGDVQPYVALTLKLMARGHTVQLAAPEQFRDLVSAHGVAFAPLPGDFLALLDTPEGKAAIAGGRGFSAGFKMLKHIRPLMRRYLDAEWRAAQSFAPDMIVYHPKSVAAPHIAEKLARPCILASPLPGFTPTSAFPSPLLPIRSLGPFNRVSHLLATKGTALLFGKLIREWRSSALGLTRPSSTGSQPTGTIYAYSRHVVPVPPDWGSDVLVSGYWFLDSPEWEPDDALRAFLAAGEPPVYVGFGSMPGIDTSRMTSVVIEALNLNGRRGLLLVGGGGALSASAAPANIHFVEHAPHDRLFPLVSAAIHHGGAGTTGAALRAGLPMTICPFFGDQPFWARCTAELGVSPPPLDRKRFTAEAVASSIATMEQVVMRERAVALGASIRTENGCASAVQFIEQRCASG